MPQLLPHGWYSLIPTVLCTMAWMSSLFQEGCDYAILRGTTVVQALADSDAPYLEVGFQAYREPYYNPATQTWSIQYTGACLEYPTTPTEDVGNDGAWQLAKFLDFVASVLGGAGAFFLWFSTCCVFSPGTWRWTGYGILFAAVFQGLSFSWFRNGLCNAADACEFSWGAKMDVVAAVMWFVAACVIFVHYPQAAEDWVDDDGYDDDDDGSYYGEDEEGELHDVDLPPLPQTDEGHVPVPVSSPPGSPSFSEQFSGEASTENEGKRMSEVKIV